MGLRLFSEFKSSNGKQYKIEIHQTGFSGTTTSFNVAEDGFKLEYSGETDDIVSPIIGSKCVVSAYNNVGTFDTFMNKVLVRQDDEFFIKILLHDGVDYNDTFWSGIIMQDLMTDNDVSKPRIVEITATDGIGFWQMKNTTERDSQRLKRSSKRPRNPSDCRKYTQQQNIYTERL